VDKILKGDTPATIPIEQASKFALVFNLKNRQGHGIADPAIADSSSRSRRRVIGAPAVR
jgi:ABC-type uncharacterized transport system substrate-binding protein